MGANLFLVLLLALVVSGLHWDGNIKLGENVTSKAIFFDLKTGISHIAWCKQVTGPNDVYLYYRQITLEGKMTDAMQMENVYGCKEIVISGHEDGKMIFIAFSGARVAGDFGCTSSVLYGCIDVFFKQSIDNGQTWSLSIPVPRNDINDFANRTAPQLIHMTETDHTMVVFTKNEAGQEVPELYHVSRKTSTTEFVREAKLLAGEKIQPSLVYTSINPKSQVLHLVWCERLGSKYLSFYAKSMDEGVTWLQRSSILKHDSGPPLIRLAVSKSAPGILFMAFPDTEYQKWTLRWTRDHGSSWSPSIISLNCYKSLAVALCAVQVKSLEMILFGLSAHNDTINFGEYSILQGQYSRGDSPFAWLPNKREPVISCMPVPAKKHIIVKALIAGGETGKTMYFSTHEFAPITEQCEI